MSERDQALKPETSRALLRVSPELLKLQLETCLARASEEFEGAAWELVKQAQVGDNFDLESLMETVQAMPPKALANKLVEYNPELNYQDLHKLPPLEPLKAVLRILTLNARLFLEPVTI